MQFEGEARMKQVDLLAVRMQVVAETTRID